MQLYYDLRMGRFSLCPWGEDSPWCHWWWHKPGPLWCPCRSRICSSSTRSQSGRPVGGENKEQTMTFRDSVSTFHYYWRCLSWSHPFIKVRDDDSRDASCQNFIKAVMYKLSLLASRQVRANNNSAVKIACGHFPGQCCSCVSSSNILPRATYQASLASVSLFLLWGLSFSDLAEEQEAHCVCMWVACWVGTSASSKSNQPSRKPCELLANHFTICWVDLLTVVPTLNWGQLQHH